MSYFWAWWLSYLNPLADLDGEARGRTGGLGSFEAELSSREAGGGGHLQGGEGGQGHRQEIQKRGQVGIIFFCV